jgi:hypothetical protein
MSSRCGLLLVVLPFAFFHAVAKDNGLKRAYRRSFASIMVIVYVYLFFKLESHTSETGTASVNRLLSDVCCSCVVRQTTSLWSTLSAG